MNISITTLLRRVSLGVALVGMISMAPAAVSEDEWYDPTDWFDGNNIESDDTYDGFYDYSYDYDYGTDWNDYGVWGNDYWGLDYYDSDYWENYDWDTNTSTLANRSGSSSSSTTASNSQKKAGSGSSSKSKSGSSSQSADDAIVYTYVLFAEPVGGGQPGSSSSRNQASGQVASSSKSGQKSSSQVARLNGTITGLKQMNLRRNSGATGSHTLANIKLENGKTSIVSLGRTSLLEDLNLKVGDSIQAIGQKGMIDGKTVFVANNFKAKGQTIAANPAIRLSQQMAQSQGTQKQNQEAGGMTGKTASQGQQMLSGEVASISRASVGQSKNQHTLVKITLKDGKSSTVDLGPAASLEKIGVEKGDTITVRGHMSQVSGQQVLVADLLKVDGEKVSSVSR